ncbi:unnamed protein product [Eruca vesicaria subsp. sativa]|uniref:Uncharacterized protein n=1 Tax=Eruca vesicaria subsp. sativa TaxID=29727 RepID=A0ABC8J2H8_ERUVS|nr:unnamed protein product [Eruca vesicaria subsp. sativa]
MSRNRSEFEVLAHVNGNYSSDRKAFETKEREYFTVNNFLESMEVEVKPHQPCREKPSQILLSKDWLALGPSISSSPITQEDNSNIIKFVISSLKISELLVDIPESTTVGSLKVAVMEAVTRILKDGRLTIGVLTEGTTIVDDSKTLLQIGISRDNDDNNHNLSSLGFTLEPEISETITTTTLTTVSPKTRLRYAIKISMESSKMRADKYVVPVRKKPPSQPEMAHRRIRRPFTGSKVEALVQAVESIGTGRWRDVKSHAFDHANYRTYVDLKDKWKTLVHTAKISARQRRGEPVPQQLLDKVLEAHALWSDR